MVLEAVKVALDPSPAQERLLLSHAGAARFAFNAGLAHVKAGIEAGDKLDWSFYSLVRWWNANKDTLAVNQATGLVWWSQNSKEAQRRRECPGDCKRAWRDSESGRPAWLRNASPNEVRTKQAPRRCQTWSG